MSLFRSRQLNRDFLFRKTNDMNYQKIYDQLIDKRKKYPLTKNKKDPNYVYCETHHIIPKSLGGTNEKSNLVNLTAREHYIAHVLLFKLYKQLNDKNAFIKMAYALSRLITGNPEFIETIDIHFNSKLY